MARVLLLLLPLVPQPAWGALVSINGFENISLSAGGPDIASNSAGGSVIVSSPVHSGSSALRVKTGGGVIGDTVGVGGLGVTNGRFSGWFYVEGTPGATITAGLGFHVDNAANGNLAGWRYTMSTGGSLTVGLYNLLKGTQVGSDATVTKDTWHYFEMQVQVATASATLSLAIDGTSVASAANQDTDDGSSTIGRMEFLSPTLVNEAAVSEYYDDIVLDDASFQGNTARVITRQVASGTETDHTYTAAGGSCANTSAELCWADTIGTDTTTSLTSAGTPVAQTAHLADFSTATGTLDAVRAADTWVGCEEWLYGQRAGGTARTYQHRRIVGGTTTNSTAFTFSTSAVNEFKSSGFWVPDGADNPTKLTNMDGAEVGVLKTGTGAELTVDDVLVTCLVKPAQQVQIFMVN
jgi:hypothetical protein